MPTIKHTVTIDTEGIVIRQSIRGGVDGPIVIEEFEEGAEIMNLDEVDGFLRNHGFLRVDAWKPGRAYNGLFLEADLIRIS